MFSSALNITSSTDVQPMDSDIQSLMKDENILTRFGIYQLRPDSRKAVHQQPNKHTAWKCGWEPSPTCFWLANID
jgi:hypothetical protein